MAANYNADTSNTRGGSIIISVAGDEYETELVEDKNPFEELHTKKKVSKLQALAISRKKNRKVSAMSSFKSPSSSGAPLLATSKQPAPNRGNNVTTHNPFDEEVPFDEGDQYQHDKASHRNPFDDNKRDNSEHDERNAGGVNPFDDNVLLAKHCNDNVKNPFDDDSI